MWSYVINAGIDFAVSLSAFAIWTHFDMEGWWEQHRIEKGRRMDAKRPPDPPSKNPKSRRREW